MFWLGFDHSPVQDAEIGSRNRHCDKGEGIDTYTSQIATVMESVRRVLRRKGRFCIVVGDSILRGKFIDMGAIYRELGAKTGFALADYFGYNQRKYTTAFTRNLKTAPKRTHILCFEKQA
jgi:hypothetical protein